MLPLVQGQKQRAPAIAAAPPITGAGTGLAATTSAATRNTSVAAAATTPSSATGATGTTGGRGRNRFGDWFCGGPAGQKEPMGLICVVRCSQ